MNQFNYYGQYDEKDIGPNGIPIEEDIELLEKQIETVMRRNTTAAASKMNVDENIINM